MNSSSIAACRATGLQGAAVLEAIIKELTFTPRAITRNPESEAALKLKARGVEVVKADMWDKASLVRAFGGSEAVFAVTNFLDPSICDGKPTGEIDQGKNMVDAAKEAAVKIFIFRQVRRNTYIICSKLHEALFLIPRHFPVGNKAVVQQYLQSSGLANASILLGDFLENFWTHGNLRRTPAGYTIAIPKFSPVAAQTFTWVTRDVGPNPVALARMTYPELAQMTSEALGGVEVTFTSLETKGISMVDDLYACVSEFGLYVDTPVPNPDLVALGFQFSTMEEFMEIEVKARFT
ncbi:hypothetical protein B0H10DRAFT_2167971 [Mycena sp. CBHHK59/15]|nr:hypothetical protein B0H10DRAFT_2167971 [Mycena sp. CBHHK59/15]